MKRMMRLLSLALCLMLVQQTAFAAIPEDYVVRHGDRESKKIAITVDDGWNMDAVYKIHELSIELDFPVTWFIVGKLFCAEDRELWEDALAHGDEFGSHTWKHAQLLEYSESSADAQVRLSQERVDEVLDIIGLSQAADRRAKGYSRGMTQRLGMGAAIIGKPELLLFDEPTSALDPGGRAEVIEIIERLKNTGCTIVLSTHILSDVERVADHIGIINNGIIAEEGSLNGVLRKYGGTSVLLRVHALDESLKNTLLSADFARVEFNGLNGVFRFTADDTEECTRRLIKLLAENNAAVDSMNTRTVSLEEVFRKVVG